MALDVITFFATWLYIRERHDLTLVLNPLSVWDGYLINGGLGQRLYLSSQRLDYNETFKWLQESF